jgi:hypothetical protein
MKVILQPPRPVGWMPSSLRARTIRSMLPYYQSRLGVYVHRIRSARQYECTTTGKSHVALALWCGATGFISKGILFHEPPADAILCATCEGRAIGTGIDGHRKINGRACMYAPRNVAAAEGDER